VTLPNIASAEPTRYFFCPDAGLYEFTRICAPKKQPGSWLLTPDRQGDKIANKEAEDVGLREVKLGNETPIDVSKGYAIERPDLFITTPLDSLFLLLPALAGEEQEKRGQKLFLTLDDYLDSLSTTSNHFRQLFRSASFRKQVELRAEAVCDHVDVGDEKMYRLSDERLAKVLVAKAKKIVAGGLPASLEQEFVQQALQKPVTVLQNDVPTTTSDDAKAAVDSQSSVASSGADDSQASAMSGATTATEASPITASSSSTPGPALHDASETIAHLLRLRTALNYMLTSYLPPHLRTRVSNILTSPASPVDFTPLDAHVAHLSDLRKTQHALRALSDNISRKRSHMGDEEAETAREEKKRKKEEDEARKKSQSRAVKQLAKADTSGMKKLSSFFSKAPASKAKS